VAELTDKYAHKDWVAPRQHKDEHGNEIGRPYYVDVSEGTEDAQHCAKRIKFTMTPGFVLVFLGILMLQGAHFGSNKRSSRELLQVSPYGLSISYIWNAMMWNAYEFMCQHIHFAGNPMNIPSGSDGYDPLFKVRYALKSIHEGLLKVWTAGKGY
jgi:hypothetical protein